MYRFVGHNRLLSVTLSTQSQLFYLPPSNNLIVLFQIITVNPARPLYKEILHQVIYNLMPCI